MSQALHIFRKDARSLHVELAVVAALNIAFVWAHIKAAAPGIEELSHPSMLAYLTSVLLAMGWWFLIARVIHQEALPGDRQFWVTRPYEWKQLLAAKLLFVLAFVNAPLLIAQIVILAAAGYASPTGLPRLLWMQFTVTLIVLAPTFAMGAVTRNFARLVLFAIGLLTGSYFLAAGLQALLFGWIPSGLVVIGGELEGWPKQAIVVLAMLAGAVLMVLWQYRGRRTAAARLAGAVTLILIILCLFLPVELRYAANAWVFHQPEARGVSVDCRPPVVPDRVPDQWGVPVDFPCTFANVPPGKTAKVEVAKATFEGSSRLHGFGLTSEPELPSGYQRFWLDRDSYRRLAGKLIAFHATLHITLQRPREWPLPNGRVTALPGGRRCTVATSGQTHTVFCVAPFHDPWKNIDFHPPDKDGHDGAAELVARSFSPWPADFAFSPVFTDNSGCEGDCAIRFRQEEPLAWFRRDIHMTVQLPPVPKVAP
jgi:hypothetical protein